MAYLKASWDGYIFYMNLYVITYLIHICIFYIQSLYKYVKYPHICIYVYIICMCIDICIYREIDIDID